MAPDPKCPACGRGALERHCGSTVHPIHARNSSTANTTGKALPVKRAPRRRNHTFKTFGDP